MPRLPPDAEEPPDAPEGPGSPRGQLEADVRRLTRAELDSMRREFKASWEWMDRQLAQQAIDEEGKP